MQWLPTNIMFAFAIKNTVKGKFKTNSMENPYFNRIDLIFLHSKNFATLVANNKEVSMIYAYFEGFTVIISLKLHYILSQLD